MEQRKAEARAKAEQLKSDPIYKAKTFGRKLLGDISQVKELIGRLQRCELAQQYVTALRKDEAEMDKSYAEIQDAMNTKDLARLKTVMESTKQMVEQHQKRFRLARGQVLELEKMEKEEGTKDDKGSKSKGHKKNENITE